jgi:hypothetical protein
MIAYKCFVGCPETPPCVLDWFPSPCMCTTAGTATVEGAQAQQPNNNKHQREHRKAE